MVPAAHDPAAGRRPARVLIVAETPAGLEALRPACETLDAFGVAWREAPDGAWSDEGWRAVIIASADGRQPAALAARSGLPVVRVPVADGARGGLDLLRDPATGDLPAAPSPEGVFATVAIGEAGAKNAALLVVSILGLTDPVLWQRWLDFRQRQTDAVPEAPPDVA